MKKKLTIHETIFKKNLGKYLIEDEVVMNWNILKKCMLMLILGAMVHLTWIIWKSFILFTPTLWPWVNLPLLKSQLMLNSFFLVLLICLIWPCYVWSNKRWVKVILPYLAVGLFVIALCREGYLIGILSPATLISYISLVTVGLVLLPRVIVYSAFIPATLYLIGCSYFSYLGVLDYAPLFQINNESYSNLFWILSMLFFMVPILGTCLALFEILLSQWRHRERLIQKLSQIDPLTNLFNRRRINQCLEQLGQKTDESYALILLDLDHFKQINDQYGHHKGDEALIKVSNILNQNLRDHDVVGRFGGEEFILILHHSTLTQAQHIAERCRQAIQNIQLQDDDGQTILVTASFGIAISTTELRPQQLLSRADKALYEAKACGRNIVKTYSAHSSPILLTEI